MGLTAASPTRIIDSRHPSFLSSLTDWEKWRLTYRGGIEFKSRYLEQFDTREDRTDFATRKRLTPVPSFAKAALNDIRNAIFQRLRDVLRVGGSENYRRAIYGLDLGVDRRGMSMNAFLGQKVLIELMVMGRCGIYIDQLHCRRRFRLPGRYAGSYPLTLRLVPGRGHPLLDIDEKPESPSQFQSITCSATPYSITIDARCFRCQTFQHGFGCCGSTRAHRKVNLQFTNLQGQEVDRDNNPNANPYVLNLDRIPFIMPG